MPADSPQSDEITTEEFNGLLKQLEVLFRGKGLPLTYSVLTFALGRIIGVAQDPAMLLASTIPKLAEAAEIACHAIVERSEDETDEEEPSHGHFTAH